MSAANADFELFRVFLEKTCGIVLGSNKQYLVSSRLNKLMEQQGIKSLGELVQRIQTQRGGLREMVVDAMTTNETLWFRDTYPFEVLKQRVLPELIKANGGQRLRIWSAACSSGQEPYSLSMAIDEFEKTNLGQLKAGVQIVATDLSGSMLTAAKAGEYDTLAMGRGLSPERLQRYFDAKGPGRWAVKPAIRSRVEFRALNLLDSYASLGKFDMVFCRNVLILRRGEARHPAAHPWHAQAWRLPVPRRLRGVEQPARPLPDGAVQPGHHLPGQVAQGSGPAPGCAGGDLAAWRGSAWDGQVGRDFRPLPRLRAPRAAAPSQPARHRTAGSERGSLGLRDLVVLTDISDSQVIWQVAALPGNCLHDSSLPSIRHAYQETSMAITALPSADGQELTIQIQGRFDFGAHQDFRDAYERVAITPRRYVVDLRNATYLDSSALGMLLLLRDHAGGENAQISLANCSPEVRKILAISNFEQLFKIS